MICDHVKRLIQASLCALQILIVVICFHPSSISRDQQTRLIIFTKDFPSSNKHPRLLLNCSSSIYINASGQPIELAPSAKVVSEKKICNAIWQTGIKLCKLQLKSLQGELGSNFIDSFGGNVLPSVLISKASQVASHSSEAAGQLTVQINEGRLS